MDRRRAGILRMAAVVIALAMLVTSCAPAAAPQPPTAAPASAQAPASAATAPAAPPTVKLLTPVTQAGFLVVYMVPLFVGIDKGFFADEGLDMKFIEIDSGQLGAGALVSGMVEFVDLGPLDVVDLQSQGKQAVLAYGLVNSLTMDMVVRKDLLEEKGVSRESGLMDRYKALEGMTIGITRPGAPTDVYPRWYMMQAGLDPEKDANFVAIGGGSALLSALESGQIDAYMLSAPTPYIAEKQGFGEILIQNSAGDVPETKDFAFTSIAVEREWAEQNPELVQAYCRAMTRANEYIAAHKEETVQFLHDNYFPDTDLETLTISLDAILPAMQADGTLSEQGIRNQLQILVDMGQLTEMPDTSEGVLWTNKYNPSAAQ